MASVAYAGTFHVDLPEAKRPKVAHHIPSRTLRWRSYRTGIIRRLKSYRLRVWGRMA